MIKDMAKFGADPAHSQSQETEAWQAPRGDCSGNIQPIRKHLLEFWSVGLKDTKRKRSSALRPQTQEVICSVPHL